MTTRARATSGTNAGPGERRSGVETAIARQAFRQVWIGATAWALVFGGTVAASALSYVSSFPSVASRHQLAAITAADTGSAVLLGPVTSIDTVGGYTVYKSFVFLTTIGAIWAILMTTRLLRGEEDTRRWQLVLAGATRASRATAATLAALGTAVAVVFCGTTLITLLAGQDPDVGFGIGETVLYGLSVVIAPAVFAAVAAVTSQVGRTRRLATGLALGVCAVAFVLRMTADSGPGARWVRWLTPFGWTELIGPYTRNDPWPLLPAGAAVLALVATATVLASRRDAGNGLLASRDVSPLRPFGLTSPVGLATRLELAVMGAWCAGAAAASFAFGIIAKATAGPAPASLGDALDRFGVHGSFAYRYFGVAFLLVATIVALLPASQIGAASDDETSGTLAHLLAQPTNRATLFVGRLALSAAGIVSAGLLAGLAAWLGTESQGVDVSLGAMVASGLNVVPTALVALGVGALTLSVAPRAAVRTVYIAVIGSLIVDLMGSMINGVGWLGHLSLFHYMALAPAQHANPRTTVTTVALAVVLGVVATVRFARRDVTSPERAGGSWRVGAGRQPQHISASASARQVRTAFDAGERGDGHPGGGICPPPSEAASRPRPTSSTAERTAHRLVWFASDTAAREPRTGARRRTKITPSRSTRRGSA